MKNFILVTALLFAGFVGINAQETSVGLQYVRNNPTANLQYQPNTDSIGVVASVTSYQTKTIGITGEASANFGNRDGQFYTALGGVTLKSRKYEAFQPFVKGLTGVGILRVRKNGVFPSRADANVAFKLAAGADTGKGKYKWRNEVAYLQSDLFSNSAHFVTVSTGIVF